MSERAIEKRECPRCGSAYESDGLYDVYYICGTRMSPLRKHFDPERGDVESEQCLRNRIATLEAEVARLGRERETLATGVRSAMEILVLLNVIAMDDDGDMACCDVTHYDRAVDVCEAFILLDDDRSEYSDIYGPIICKACGKDSALSECANCSNQMPNEDQGSCRVCGEPASWECMTDLLCEEHIPPGPPDSPRSPWFERRRELVRKQRQAAEGSGSGE